MDDSATWDRVQDLFSQAIELPPEERPAFLAREANGNQTLIAEVRSLLGHDRNNLWIDAAIGAAAGDIPPADPETVTWTGRRLGAYCIEREIGHGGMGTVFEAVRADDEFQKRVAVKVAARAQFSAEFRQRFRHERQILAGLEHPNIARLIDGGATAEGLPFFAMEYVEGQQITDYANQKNLTVRDRIRLFLDVCGALDYAHEHLVVHRDLKPANILVDTAGHVKLLDFGIAKILEDGELQPGQTLAQTLTHAMTPDYCAPEQVRGERVTMRTDVYQLGLVLFELLVGERGQKVATLSPGAMEKSICEVELPRASTQAKDAKLQRTLNGDLDNILAKAAAKDADRRYPSVAAFADDLKRYLDGLPVAAHAGSAVYRAGKFLRRNRIFVGGFALLAVAIGAGIFSTIHQARRAERRFAQVRSLANTFIYDTQDQVANLPGSTEVRKRMVQTGLNYLENLREEAAGDASLSRELADAYLRIGDVSGGDVVTRNLGDSKGAIESYRKAEALLLPLPRDEKTAILLGRTWLRQGVMERNRGQAAIALSRLEQSAAVVEPLLRTSPSTDSLALYAEVQIEISRMHSPAQRHEKALDAANRALDATAKLVEREPTSAKYVNLRAVAFTALGLSQGNSRNLEGAARSHRESVALREQAFQMDPGNVELQRGVMLGWGFLGDLLGFRVGSNLGDVQGAVTAFDQASRIAEAMLLHDPKDSRARKDVAHAHLRSAVILLDIPGRLNDARIAIDEAIQKTDDALRDDPEAYNIRYNHAYLQVKKGECLIGLNRPQEASKPLEAALEETDGLRGGATAIGARNVRARALITLAKVPRAVADKGALATQIAAEIAKEPKLFESAWSASALTGDLGRLFCSAGLPANGSQWLQKSLKNWTELKLPAALEVRRRSEIERVRKDLETCAR